MGSESPESWLARLFRGGVDAFTHLKQVLIVVSSRLSTEDTIDSNDKIIVLKRRTGGMLGVVFCESSRTLCEGQVRCM